MRHRRVGGRDKADIVALKVAQANEALRMSSEPGRRLRGFVQLKRLQAVLHHLDHAQGDGACLLGRAAA